MTPSLTVAMIVKDVAAYITPCIESARPIADEFVIVDTGSTDETIALLRRLLDGTKHKIIPIDQVSHPDLFMLDDDKLATFGIPGPFSGRIMLADFGGARQVGWDQATSDYVIWIDSDDVITGTQQVPLILQGMARDGLDTIMLPYDYAHDGHGHITCELLRERIVKRSGPARWAQPVHEVLCPAGIVRVVKDGPRIVHRRQEITAKTDVANRNIKILLRHYQNEVKRVGGNEASVDARLFFYLGMEMRYINMNESMRFFDLHARYSGWDEEKSVARMWRGDMLESQGKIHEAFSEYCAAHIEFPRRPDQLFRLSRNAYFRNNWAKCIEFAEHGWKLMEGGSEPSVIQFDPLERELMPLVFASVAYLKVGRVKEALACCDKGLKIRPDEPHLLGNKQLAEKWLGDHGDGPPKPVKLDFKMSEPIESEAPELAPQIEALFAVHLWKRLRAEHSYDKAARLLDSLPLSVSSVGKVEDARRFATKFMVGRVGVTGPENINITQEFKAQDPDRVFRSFKDSLDGMARGPSVTKRSLDIILWTGPAWEDWSPKSIDTTGIGGSETAAVMMAKELVARGHRVRVYTQCGKDGGTYDGVEYIDFNKLFSGDNRADVLISSRQPEILTSSYHGYPPKVTAKVRILWVHDVHCGPPTPVLEQALLRADRIFCLSEWHKKFFLETYPALDPATVVVTRNSVDLARFAPGQIVRKQGNRLIYASSPDRGLLRLVELFPAIRTRVPDAELHVYYGFDTWELMAIRNGNNAQREQITAYRQLLERYKDAGITYHGRVNQKELAEAFIASKVWPYPTWFSETSCITAMEAQAAGCVPVATLRAALGETVQHGILLQPPETTAEFGADFVNMVVRMLQDDAARMKIADAGRSYAFANYGWNKVASDWEAELFRLLDAAERQPIMPAYADERLP